MNAAYLHLILNHIPIIGVGLGLFLFLLSFYQRLKHLRSAALILWLVSGIAVLPTYLAGEEAEDIVENLAGVDEPHIEEHEEIALPAAMVTGFLALMSLIALIIKSKKGADPRSLTIFLFFISLLSMGLLVWTAQHGGHIRHPEASQDFNPSKSHQHQH